MWLSDSFSVTGVLSLANLLNAISEATLYRVDVLQRVRVNGGMPGSAIPARYRIAARPNEAAFLDGYHALIPANDDEAAFQSLLDELFRNDNPYCTRTGVLVGLSSGVYYERVTPNFRAFESIVPVKRYALVLDNQLWRDLLITSMALNSESLRDELQNPTSSQALARRQLVELVRGVDLDEIISRLDQIIALLQQEDADSDTALALLQAILEALNG